MKLESASCALCGDAESKKILDVNSLRLKSQRITFNLRQCLQCGLVFTSPRPAPEEMAKLYGTQFYFTRNAPWLEFINRSVTRQRARFTRQSKTSGRVLDVGCGTGGFLREMNAKGFEVHGLEPYQNVLEHVPENLQKSIHIQPFEQVSLPEGSFDVITMWHVLEHLAQPLEMLQRVLRLLKADGVLVLEVPDFASSESRWMGRHWHHLDAPYHFWHWTPGTLRELAARAGYKSVEMRTGGGLHPWTIFNYLLLGTGSVEKALREKWPALEGVLSNMRLTKPLSLPLLLLLRLSFFRSPPMMRLIGRK